MIISSNWHESKYEAWRHFNLEHEWRAKKQPSGKFDWVKEPEVFEENGKFKVEGITQ